VDSLLLNNPIEFATALGDASRPEPDRFAISLIASATPFKAPSLGLYRY